jgi:hypothetical protein
VPTVPFPAAGAKAIVRAGPRAETDPLERAETIDPSAEAHPPDRQEDSVLGQLDTTGHFEHLPLDESVAFETATSEMRSFATRLAADTNASPVVPRHDRMQPTEMDLPFVQAGQHAASDEEAVVEEVAPAKTAPVRGPRSGSVVKPASLMAAVGSAAPAAPPMATAPTAAMSAVVPPASVAPAAPVAPTPLAPPPVATAPTAAMPAAMPPAAAPPAAAPPAAAAPVPAAAPPAPAPVSRPPARVSRGMRAFGFKSSSKELPAQPAAPAAAASEAPPATTTASADTATATATASPTKVPISTAPSSLPPPSEKQSATSGPSPACPQCESPMAWVEEHLRFYCKSCKMYF